MKRLIGTICLTLALLLGNVGVGYTDNLLSTLKSGNHLVLIRHARAPGYSDPDYLDQMGLIRL